MKEQLKNEWLYVKIYLLVTFLTNGFYRLSLRLTKEIYNYWLAYNRGISKPVREILEMLLGPVDNLFKKIL